MFVYVEYLEINNELYIFLNMYVINGDNYLRKLVKALVFKNYNIITVSVIIFNEIINIFSV